MIFQSILAMGLLGGAVVAKGTEATVPASTTPPSVTKANEIFTARHKAIDALIAKKNYAGALELAQTMFSIDTSHCRKVVTEQINAKDESGNELVAHTTLDQTVTLDPRFAAFKNSRFLVSILSHEVTHCDQNQKMYELAIANDPSLEILKGKIPELKTFAELDEALENVVKSTATDTQAEKSYKTLLAAYKLDVSPDQFLGIRRRIIESIQTFKRTLSELHEMEASLKAFEVPGALPPPGLRDKASEEFEFQYKFLFASTNKLLRTRKLYGAEGDSACRMTNFVPLEMSLQHERTCNESIRLIQTYFGKIRS